MSKKQLEVGNLLNYVVENGHSLAAIFDADGFSVSFLTDNTEELIGVPKQKIQNDIWTLINIGKIMGYNKPLSKENLLDLKVNERYDADLLEVVNQATGENMYFRGSVKKVKSGDSENFMLVWTDRTDEVTRNKQMEEMIAVANAANEAKTSFLANMSHDFRTPMNAITNFNLLIAKNSANPQKIRDYTHKIGLACQNLLSLLNDVLDMSKIESGKTKLSSEEFALGLLLEEVNSVIAFQAKGKQQDYQVHSGGMQQDIFLGDKQRINEVLVNILGNAVKYTPEGGRIDLYISEEKQPTGDYWDVKFVVKDNGVGMSKEYQRSLFEAFTREEKESTKGIQGTGLGMAITKNLVEMMGGTIKVDSVEGKGSAFEITLRLMSVNQDQGDFWSNHGIHRILVIDDDVQECEKIETALHDTDVEIFFSTSGYKALHLIEISDQEHRGFDVILLGMQIRSISCFELAKRIKFKQLSSSPILLLLTDDWEYIAEDAREAGIFDFVQKPFFMSTFQQLVEDIVNRTSTVKKKTKNEPLEGMRFLAAEDNDINADILTELMGIEGAKIERAIDGNAVVDMFYRSAPGYYDMILMDIQMPGKNGYEAAKAIRDLDREDAKTIPIIAMTANAYADDVQKALQSGMNAHVAKPIDMKIVEETISEIRENRRST
ncbi:MAG: response regulator [Butyrivibrio sp.]|nr:response regulator [Butyrivibrio sp.]